MKNVIYFAETGSSPNQKDATNEINLLLIAIEQGHYDILKYLIEIGADVNANANTHFLGEYVYSKQNLIVPIINVIILYNYQFLQAPVTLSKQQKKAG